MRIVSVGSKRALAAAAALLRSQNEWNVGQFVVYVQRARYHTRARSQQSNRCLNAFSCNFLLVLAARNFILFSIFAIVLTSYDKRNFNKMVHHSVGRPANKQTTNNKNPIFLTEHLKWWHVKRTNERTNLILYECSKWIEWKCELKVLLLNSVLFLCWLAFFLNWGCRKKKKIKRGN